MFSAISESGRKFPSASTLMNDLVVKGVLWRRKILHLSISATSGPVSSRKKVLLSFRAFFSPFCSGQPTGQCPLGGLLKFFEKLIE